jgi:pyrroline-5-carboxylate reductase
MEVFKMKESKIGFIGAGNMASALIQGMIQSGQFTTEQIRMNNKSNLPRRRQMVAAYAIPYVGKRELVRWADVLILAVKPQDLFDVLEEISPLLTERKLIISIAAGVDIKSISATLTNQVPLIRAMPNMSARVLSSATALAVGKLVLTEEYELARRIFFCVGSVHQVPEAQMDAVTGLSGSGPAYVYTFLKAMIEGGEQLGLSHADAGELALQTIRGAIEMITVTGDEPSELTRQICSPNGTTLAGLSVLESHHFQENIVEAIRAASRRSEELRLENRQRQVARKAV